LNQKEGKKNVVYINGGRVEETFPNKGILEKLIRERNNLAFYIAINKAETPNKP
jgi:hypothetical protein